MNAAFRRGEAITRLESYAEVIVLHITMLVCFPDNQEVNHWKKELNAFCGRLRRFNKSKARHPNFKRDIIVETLADVIDSNEGKDYIVNGIIGGQKGLSIEYTDVDWDAVENKITDFADAVMEN